MVRGILTEEKLQFLNQKLTNIRAAADVGKLPTKLVSAYSSFTADKLENWTILFLVYGLKVHCCRSALRMLEKVCVGMSHIML